jgi:hypothetical protein
MVRGMMTAAARPQGRAALLLPRPPLQRTLLLAPLLPPLQQQHPARPPLQRGWQQRAPCGQHASSTRRAGLCRAGCGSCCRSTSWKELCRSCSTWSNGACPSPQQLRPRPRWASLQAMWPRVWPSWPEGSHTWLWQGATAGLTCARQAAAAGAGLGACCWQRTCGDPVAMPGTNHCWLHCCRAVCACSGAQ